MNTRRLVSWILLSAALGVGAAACGGSGSGSSSAPSSPASSASQAATSSTSPATEIAANWTAFFNPKTPVAQRVNLLQDGSRFASIIRAQAGSALASTASAKVTNVTVKSASEAAVTYNILVAGTPALKHQAGVAVLQNGTWKVGVASFCGLLTLENAGKTPAACKSAA